MNRLAAFLIGTFTSVTIGVAADSSCPAELVGRWDAIQIQTRGDETEINEVQPRLEFTPSQVKMYFDRSIAEPTHVFDYTCDTTDDRIKLDLRTAANSPGPERGLHVRAICQIDEYTLWICSSHSDDSKVPGQYPSKFASSRESRTDLYVLRRVK